MGKGQQTRQAILGQALVLSSECGLSGLSIGLLAEKSGMSKSGLFSHFGSKEELQLAVIREAQDRFAEVVVRPALKERRGLARLRAMVRNGIVWTQKINLPGGCPLMSAALEFDDQPGAVRDAVESSQRDWRRTLVNAVRIAMDVGELAADTDPEQVAFEIVGISLATQQGQRLLRDADAEQRAMRAFERLVRDYLAVPS
ncbi:MAG: TetR/AcrR family transcriptional regulator [Proteobacteria bacterium]|nr:TetR/AcrR family transcriptional regulator [Pseudomonadota bacterium]